MRHCLRPDGGDTTTCADALEIVKRYQIDIPVAASALLESGAGETVKPGDVRLANSAVRIITAPQLALEAAATLNSCCRCRLPWRHI